MKVLHQVNNLAIGGVETYVYRLAKYANEEETVIYSHKDGIVRSWLEAAGIPVYFDNIEDVIEQRGIDVVVFHTGSYLPEYARSLKDKFPNIKFITVLHTLYTVPGEERWVDAIVAVAQSVGDVNEGSFVIYPGIEMNERYVIGEVTRLAPYKYLEDIIELASILHAKNLKYKPLFRIYGSDAADFPGYGDHLKELIKEKQLEEYFEFYGYVDEIPWDSFDAFIHLVGNEVYPVTILEALNHRLRTFSYMRRGTDEILDNDRYSPLVLQREIGSIAEAMEKYINGRAKHIKFCANEFSFLYHKVMEAK